MFQLKTKSEFSRNVLTLVTGTTIAQALPIAVAPILTRIYSPEDFGLFAFYFAIVSVIAVLATARYELAIALPKKKDYAYQIVILSSLISTAMSLLTLFLIWLFQSEILGMLDNQEISNWLYWVPLSVFLIGIYQSLYYWFNREKCYANMANSRVVQSSTMLGTQVSLGLIGNFSALGLIIGQVVGQVLAVVYMGKKFSNDTRNLYKPKKVKQFALAKRYINFPKFLLVAHIMNAIARQLPSIFFNILFTSTIAGFYILIQRVVGAPMTIIASAIGDVFRQQASQAYRRRGECVTEYKNALKKLTIISILPFTAFVFIAPDLFAVVFGGDWRLAGEYAQILAPMFFLQFIASPLSNMFLIAEKQKEDLIMQVFLFSGVIFVFLFSESVSQVLSIFSAIYSLIYLWVIFKAGKFSRGNNEKVI